jgi:hypothetical protein
LRYNSRLLNTGGSCIYSSGCSCKSSNRWGLLLLCRGRALLFGLCLAVCHCLCVAGDCWLVRCCCCCCWWWCCCSCTRTHLGSCWCSLVPAGRQADRQSGVGPPTQRATQLPEQSPHAVAGTPAALQSAPGDRWSSNPRLNNCRALHLHC